MKSCGIMNLLITHVTDSTNGLLFESTKPLTEPMSINHVRSRDIHIRKKSLEMLKISVLDMTNNLKIFIFW